MKRAVLLFAWTLLVVVLTVLTVEVVRTGGIAAPLVRASRPLPLERDLGHHLKVNDDASGNPVQHRSRFARCLSRAHG